MEDTLRDLEYTLAFHGAPALAGIKPADLVAWGSPQVCMGTLLEDYRRQLSRCGIQLRLLCSCRPRCLILVYRPERLAAQLARPQVRALLAREGFVVLPYMYPDLYAARALADAGAAAVMPLASPIGSNKGLATRDFIQILIDEIDLPIIVDAGIGRPSQACEAMEMGAAAIMANTALATAGDLPLMAAAFRQAIEAGRKAYLSGPGRVLSRGAAPSDPLTGFLRD